jgi:Glutaredoxin-like domain (DUF836)
MPTALISAKLFSTSNCHLCEEAEAILHHAGVKAEKIDILDDDSMFEKYSLRIPVLKRIDNDAELNWPFDAVNVLRFLQ